MAERKTQPMREVTNAELGVQVGKIVDAIYGNGHEGINVRLARIEENLEASSELLKTNAGQVVRLGEVSARLEKAVEIHHAKDHLADLMKKKEFWAFIVLGYMGLHMIATYVPDLLNFLLTLVGLPHLPAP